MGKLLGVENGVVETFHKNADGTFTIQKSQDVEGILKDNAIDKNASSSGWKGDMHKVASVPMVIVEQWWKELGSDPFHKKNRKWLIAKLNSSEWSKLRTKEGRL